VTGFVGQYEHQMDEKGRVSLPSAFRREADSETFVLLQWEPDYLTLFPATKWGEVQERLLEFRRSDPKAWNQVRLIVSNAVEVSPDKQGRILVPASLQAAAELSGSVLLSGNIDRVELWDPSKYEATVREDAGDIRDFSLRRTFPLITCFYDALNHLVDSTAVIELITGGISFQLPEMYFIATCLKDPVVAEDDDPTSGHPGDSGRG